MTAAPRAKVLALPASPLLLAEQQIKQAVTERKQNLAEFPHLPWVHAMSLVGPLLPGQLWTVGARPANGKTTFMLNILNELAMQRIPVMYVCTETQAAELRSIWAALRLGYEAGAVVENAWHRLPEGAREAVASELESQGTMLADIALFVDMPSLTGEKVGPVLKEYAVRQQFRIVIVDHIHRWQVRQVSQKTAELTEVVQKIKGYAAEHGLTILLAAQCARPERKPLAEFYPPSLGDLQQTSALEQESNVVMMLHQKRKADVTAAMVKEVQLGQREVSELIEPNTMCVSVQKHRNRPKARGRMFTLSVSESCRLEEPASLLPPPPREREPGEEPDLPF